MSQITKEETQTGLTVRGSKKHHVVSSNQTSQTTTAATSPFPENKPHSRETRHGQFVTSVSAGVQTLQMV